MPLHIDYRPADFDEILGNEETIKSIKSILARDEDRPHAWMFVGPSGCGKTTLARIVSAALGCPPKINKAANLDFQEINTSDMRGIDTAREILKTMNFAPVNTASKCRVYILDECHQATKDFQNSLLKALEDTPDHVYFLLCTTDPSKLLKTIKNRCSKYEVKPLREGLIMRLITEILASEGVEDFTGDEISQIADTCEGCPREALVMLDQVIDVEPDARMESIVSFSDTRKKAFDLAKALINPGIWTNDVAPILKDLEKEDPEGIRRLVLAFMKTALLKNWEPKAILVLDCFNEPFYNTGFPGLVRACALVYSD